MPQTPSHDAELHAVLAYCQSRVASELEHGDPTELEQRLLTSVRGVLQTIDDQQQVIERNRNVLALNQWALLAPIAEMFRDRPDFPSTIHH